MNLSFWEWDRYFNKIDFVIVGSGIAGLSTAYHLKSRHPNAKLLILERGILPEGASTKNAGFACFGSLSEIIGNLNVHTKDEVAGLVQKRYTGLQRLRKLLGDEVIGFTENGYELFRKEDTDLFNHCIEQIDSINDLLYPVFNKNIFELHPQKFGFEQIEHVIHIHEEGQIDTGKMMKAYLKLIHSLDINILNNCTVTSWQDNGNNVQVELENRLIIDTQKLILCTNGLTSKLLPEEDVVPARAQVLITKPIENLKFRGGFHFDEGFYYFRTIGKRILFGGGRNLDIKAEETSEFGLTDLVQNQLEKYLKEIILPHQPYEVERRWSGIMAMGKSKTPIVKQLSENVFGGFRLSGTGIAIGTTVGNDLSEIVG